jgi:hypothetical protein
LKRRDTEINWSKPSNKLVRYHKKASGSREKLNKKISEEEYVQQIQGHKRNDDIPIVGHTTQKLHNSKIKIIPRQRPKGYLQNLRTHQFLICTVPSEKGTKSNSGGYKVQGNEDTTEMTDEEVLKAKVPPEYHSFKDVFSAKEAKELPPY